MKAKHRKVLRELMDLCAYLGNELDYTATHISKLKDRQKAHRYVFRALYGILVDSPKNECIADDWARLEESLTALRELRNKIYPDSQGYK